MHLIHKRNFFTHILVKHPKVEAAARPAVRWGRG